MKIAIVTDTTSGLTPQQAQALGVWLVPMPVTIAGREYLESVDLDRDFFFRALEEGSPVTTSQPSPGTLTELWEQLLQEHDGLVYLPMTSGLSSSYANALTMAEEYEGRVQVVDTKRISVPLWQSVQDAITLSAQGLSPVDICRRLEENALNCSIYLLPATLEYLKRGGRITPAAAAIGTVLNIRPVLQIQGGRIDAYAKIRGTKQAVQRMFAALDEDLATRFVGMPMRVFAAYSGEPSVGAAWEEQMREHYGSRFVRIDPLALNISCHTGPGTIALGCTRVEE